MGVLSKGTDFTNGDQVTDTSLDNLVDNATFTTSAVDEVSTGIGGTGAIIVKDEGITTGKLANSTGAGDGVTTAKLATAAVTEAKIGTDAVTTAKIADANVTFAKLTDVIDDDTMATATATTLATSESIKAYVDSAGPLEASTATGTITTTSPNAFQDFDLSSVVGANKAMVIMEVFGGNQIGRTIFFRTKGSSVSPYGASVQAGSNTALLGTSNNGNTVIVTTDSSGFLEVLTGGVAITNINYVVQAFQVIS
jgi:hypothetical protein